MCQQNSVELVTRPDSLQMALVSDGPETTNVTDILERAEIEVWDNNVIVQLAIPQSLKKCKTYRVGATTESMTEHPLPQLKEFRMKKNQLQVSTKLNPSSCTII